MVWIAVPNVATWLVTISWYMQTAWLNQTIGLCLIAVTPDALFTSCTSLCITIPGKRSSLIPSVSHLMPWSMRTNCPQNFDNSKYVCLNVYFLTCYAWEISCLTQEYNDYYKTLKYNIFHFAIFLFMKRKVCNLTASGMDCYNEISCYV